MNIEELDDHESLLNLPELVHGVLRAARHMLRVGIVLMVALAAALCLYTRASYTPLYKASASFAVRVSNPLYGSQQYYNVTAASQMAQTFPSILTSGLLSHRVKQTLNIDSMPSVSASVMGSTNIFNLTVTSSDAKLAHDVLECVIDIYPDVAEFVVGPTTLTLLDETGLPASPSNPLDLRAAAVRGAFLGFLLWLCLSALYWITHRTVCSEKELGQVVNLPCLGNLPKAAGHGRKNRDSYPRISENNDKFGFSESIRLLRVHVEQAMAQHHAQVLMVTSTIANEGKTTASMNLATALAEAGKKTLLVDCDLRNPSIAGAMEASQQAGFSDYLLGRKKITDLLTSDGASNLYVIYGGSPVRNPEKLLASDATRNFLTAARTTFDYVILDTPPCTMMADASEVSTLADCTLLTVRQDFACRSQIVEGIQLLGDSGKPIIGCVLNMTTPRMGHGSYSYSYYGYYGK